MRARLDTEELCLWSQLSLSAGHRREKELLNQDKNSYFAKGQTEKKGFKEHYSYRNVSPKILCNGLWECWEPHYERRAWACALGGNVKHQAQAGECARSTLKMSQHTAVRATPMRDPWGPAVAVQLHVWRGEQRMHLRATDASACPPQAPACSQKLES